MKAKPSESKKSQPMDTPAVAQDGYMLKREIAARLRKTERTVEAWMRQGIIPHIKIGKGRRAAVLFSWPEVQKSLAARFGRGTASACN